ncbi:hypothetical protein [Nonomuraea sp. NPDC050643]|uniref:hypothetical protein n=1 Tax=Nonomuraea sp. NPDC050643 TaxID=3155660 RepID=UPI00340EC1F1
MPTAISWQDLRRRPAGELQEGDQWFVLAAFITYTAASDGTVHGHGWERPDGTVWRLVSRDGGKVTAADQDGHVLTEAVPHSAQVLKVERRT